MSCGKPHETPCRDVLSAVFLYLDHELNESTQLQAIEVHLQECPPCGQQYDVERRLHELVMRCCSDVEAPATVRQRVIQRITELRIEMTLGGPESE